MHPSRWQKLQARGYEPGNGVSICEYQKELLEKYEIFALDTGYETSQYGEDMVIRRLGIMERRIWNIRVRKESNTQPDHGGAGIL